MPLAFGSRMGPYAIVYASNESGEAEVYVLSLDGAAGKARISTPAARSGAGVATAGRLSTSIRTSRS